MADVLVILASRASADGPALEALRTSVGLAAGGHRVRLLLQGPEEALRTPENEYLLETFARLGGVVAPAQDLADALDGAEYVVPWGG